MAEQFVFSGRAKRISLTLIGIGVIAVIAGFLTYPERQWANLLLCSYYFVSVCLIGGFFVALQYVANAGWATALKRIPEAFGDVLPIAGGLLIVIVSAGLLTHNLYHHWADPNLIIETLPDGSPNPQFDELIKGKSGFLNVPFFLARIIGFILIWTILTKIMRKLSLREDKEGGLKAFNSSLTYGSIFIVILGFSSAVFSFDIIMSIDAHWFSTMFAWYNFASMWVSSLAIITLTIILLKENGYLSYINQNHLHDLGKFIFAFSIFWTYVWVAQFMLIWYANLPEEAVYFDARWKPEYKWIFWLNVVVNFLMPFLILMTRDAKRSVKVLKLVCIIVICGHWLDFYMMIMPGSVGAERGFNYIEVGTFLGFIGLFSFFMLRALAKAPLLPKNHPYLEESLHHQV